MTRLVHIITVHHNSARWIDIQLRKIGEHVGAPVMVWASLQGVGEEHWRKFDRVIPSMGQHAGKLNLLAAEVIEEADPADLLMFLDGDAFPIADPTPKCRRLLESSSLVAVRREENLGDPQPHPCFAMTYAGTWRELGGDWSMGYPWVNSNNKEVTDVGGNLLRLLQLGAREWSPLRRTNQIGDHPLWFGVYGGVVYHHGAGFRPVLSRGDSVGLPFGTEWNRCDVVRRKLYKGCRAIQSWRGGRISRTVYEQITKRPGYVEGFAGEAPGGG